MLIRFLSLRLFETLSFEFFRLFQSEAQNRNKMKQENVIQNLITIITKTFKIWIQTANKAAVLFSRAGSAF